MLRLAAVLSVASIASSLQLSRSLAPVGVASPRARPVKALVPPEAGASFLLSGLGEMVGLQGYGGVSAFSQSDSAQTGDLNQVVALSIVFPTLVTALFFKDSILDAFTPDPYNEDQLPPGWRKVPSTSRPGQFSYEQTATKERYDKLPPAARKGMM